MTRCFGASCCFPPPPSRGSCIPEGPPALRPPLSQGASLRSPCCLGSQALTLASRCGQSAYLLLGVFLKCLLEGRTNSDAASFVWGRVGERVQEIKCPAKRDLFWGHNREIRLFLYRRRPSASLTPSENHPGWVLPNFGAWVAWHLTQFLQLLYTVSFSCFKLPAGAVGNSSCSQLQPVQGLKELSLSGVCMQTSPPPQLLLPSDSLSLCHFATLSFYSAAQNKNRQE